MPIKKIKQFIDWAVEGSSTYEKRLAVFLEHKKNVEEQMAALQMNMDKIDYKIWFYENAIEKGQDFVQEERDKNVLAQPYLKN